MVNAARVWLPAVVGALLIWLLASGHIYLLIHERSIWLVALSVPVLAAMTYVALRSRGSTHGDATAVLLLALPVVFGVVVPARPLGSFAVDQQTASNATTASWQPTTSFAFDGGNVTWDLHQLARVQASDPTLRDFEG